MAFVQGSILTAGYWLLGVPSAILLGILTMVFAFVPVVGSALVWLPTALVLFLSGKPQAAISVLVLGGVIVSNIDNVLRPLIQNRLGEIHPLMSIVGVIVGLPLFGVIGLVIGPVLVFLCLELTRLILNGNTKEA
jgi:predicted PurR-regulated permease PerM